MFLFWQYKHCHWAGTLLLGISFLSTSVLDLSALDVLHVAQMVSHEHQLSSMWRELLHPTHLCMYGLFNKVYVWPV